MSLELFEHSDLNARNYLAQQGLAVFFQYHCADISNGVITQFEAIPGISHNARADPVQVRETSTQDIMPSLISPLIIRCDPRD